MFKYIVLLLTAYIFSPTPSYAMLSKERDPREGKRSKVFRSANFSRTEIPAEKANSADSRFLQDLRSTCAQVQQRQTRETMDIYLRILGEVLGKAQDQPKTSAYSGIFTSCDIMTEFVSNITLTEQQVTKIQETLAEKGLNLREMLQMRGNFVNSLKSGLKYIKNASELMEKEREFYEGNSLSFPSNLAYAGDILPFSHPLRKELIVRIRPVPSQKIYFISTCIEDFNKEDPQNPISLMRLYTKLFGFSAVNLSMCQAAEPRETSAHVKYKRLTSSLFDGETELFLKYSELLHPYAVLIQNILKIDGFDEIFTYQKRIEDALVQRRVETGRRPAFSRNKISALQERYRLAEEKTDGSKLPNSMKKIVSQEKYFTSAYGESSSETPQNLKSEYRQPSEQEIRDVRKREAKEKKKAEAALSSKSKNMEPVESVEEKKKAQSTPRFTIKIGGGPFKIYGKIMDETFKGVMEKVVILIESLGGSVDEGRSGSRLKIELPHVNNNKITYLDMLPPEYEDESETEAPDSQTQTTVTITESVIHTPHKGKSRKLRPYHTKDIRELLIEAGYTEDAVQRQ